jgi:hypothetical protein
MTATELRAFALGHGLGPTPKETGINYIVETKTFGRWGCKVDMESGLVKAVTYNFAS